eukprot:463186_1
MHEKIYYQNYMKTIQMQMMMIVMILLQKNKKRKQSQRTSLTHDRLIEKHQTITRDLSTVNTMNNMIADIIKSRKNELSTYNNKSIEISEPESINDLKNTIKNNNKANQMDNETSGNSNVKIVVNINNYGGIQPLVYGNNNSFTYDECEFNVEHGNTNNNNTNININNTLLSNILRGNYNHNNNNNNN